MLFFLLLSLSFLLRMLFFFVLFNSLLFFLLCTWLTYQSWWRLIRAVLTRWHLYIWWLISGSLRMRDRRRLFLVWSEVNSFFLLLVYFLPILTNFGLHRRINYICWQSLLYCGHDFILFMLLRMRIVPLILALRMRNFVGQLFLLLLTRVVLFTTIHL